MKHFLKVFSIAFLCFTLAVGAGIFTYFQFQDAEASGNVSEGDNEQGNDDIDFGSNEEDIADPLQIAFKESKRINVLLLGMEGPRSDTIMFATFDPETKKIDMISIPRDTYYLRPGEKYAAADKRKINAVYGDHGVDGVKTVVQDILGGVPIHHYVRVNYDGVEKIVDNIGGVEVNVPFHMEYYDPYDKPPLRIDIPAGRQVLNGNKAMQYLRFRHNNDYTVGYKDGDLGRIRAQQQFIKAAIKKSLSFKNLPAVVKTIITYVKTDIGITDALVYTKDIIGINTDNIEMTTLPGEAKYIQVNGQSPSYFVYDSEKIQDFIKELYDVSDEEMDEASENENN